MISREIDMSCAKNVPALVCSPPSEYCVDVASHLQSRVPAGDDDAEALGGRDRAVHFCDGALIRDGLDVTNEHRFASENDRSVSITSRFLFQTG